MVDPKAFLKAALQLHGHECPELILGLRAGAAAMNWLGVERSVEGQLLALVQFPQGRRYAQALEEVEAQVMSREQLSRCGRPRRRRQDHPAARVRQRVRGGHRHHA